MRISSEEIVIKNYSENLINRKYRGIRTKRNRSIVLAGLTFGFAAAEAVSQKGFMTIFMGGCTLFNLRVVEVGTNVLRMLRPQYLEILDRAKSINKIRQLQ